MYGSSQFDQGWRGRLQRRWNRDPDDEHLPLICPGTYFGLKDLGGVRVQDLQLEPALTSVAYSLPKHGMHQHKPALVVCYVRAKVVGLCAGMQINYTHRVVRQR